MKKFACILIFTILFSWFGNCYAAESETQQTTFKVWFGNQATEVNFSDFNSMVKDGNIYAFAINDLITDIGWHTITEGNCYKITKVDSMFVYIIDDWKIEHPFFITDEYWGDGSSYAHWLSLYFYKPDPSQAD